jgi:acetylornithine/succinyldiaminopimelate/putrescine aminotransferase
MAAMGCYIFLEVGPQPTLIGMGRRILTGSNNIWLESLHRGRSDWTTLLTSLGKLYCRGQDVDWKGYDQDYARSHVPLPTYPFDRRRFWVKHPRTFVASASEGPGSDVPAVLPERLPNQITVIEAYENYARPLVSRLLHVGYLDKCFHRASGDRMWYMVDGREIEVVDLVGGYGSVVFGHNHPELVDHACKILNDKKPVHAQASIRGEAALLCREISEQLCAYTGQRFVTTLVNSGTEAIEAAIKHAEIEYQVLANAELQKADRAFALLTHEYRDKSWKPHTELLGQLREIVGGEALGNAGLNRIHRALVAHNESILSGPPTFLALKRAFHGRTSGATCLTANPDFMTSYGRAGLQVVRIKPGDVSALEEAVQAHRHQLWHLREAPTGEPRLVSHTWSRIAALFVEPVQGEGGVRPLPNTFIKAINKLTDHSPFPVIVDEIQSGLGRCGAFTASEILALLKPLPCV